MQRKVIWTIFLIFGISIFIISCGKTITEYRVKGEFQYINNSSAFIVLAIDGTPGGAIYKEYEIWPNDTLILFTEGESHEKIAYPQNYLPAISGDTTTLFVNDTLCYREYGHQGSNLQNINSYTFKKRSDRDYVFYYNIDSSIVALAKKCN